jgi:glycosyltransferase involved in cell wall biosynthesis
LINPTFERPARAGVAWRLLRLGFAAIHLLKTLTWRRPKIVHFFLPESYVIGAPLAALAFVPVRVMSRRCLNEYQKAVPLLASVERWLHTTMSAVLGNSKSIISQLRNREGVPSARLGLIYNGLDLDRFSNLQSRAEARASLHFPADAFLFVMVANLIPYKGHADALRAFSKAKDILPRSWQFLIVGRDDGIGKTLKTLSGELGVADHVCVMGLRSDVPEILAAADVGVHCSHQEGFSNAILEGMAAGLPMIVTDVGGNAEAVLHEETGLVVAAREPESLAGAFIRLSDSADLRARYGRAARERAFKHFALDQCVEAYDALYRRLLSGGRPVDVEQVHIDSAAAR